MGATNFEVCRAFKKPIPESMTSFTEASAQTKALFIRAIQDALFIHGHSGYTGTIAEKSEYKFRKWVAMTQDDAQTFIRGTAPAWDGDQEKNDKWGPAFAILIKSSNRKDAKIVAVTFYGLASE
jgi:hypothetical protein